MSEAVKLSSEGGVATIALNRPQVMNAMDGGMMQQLRPIAEAVEKRFLRSRSRPSNLPPKASP